MLSWSGFYAILDLGALSGRDPLAAAEALLAASPVALQLRAKQAPARDLLSLARSLAERCQRAGVPLVVNDRADIAHLSGAWGVHLGQDDLDIDDVRRLFPALHVGLSTHNLDQVQRALSSRADYLGFGPVFTTRTKQNPDPTTGLDALSLAVQKAGSVPVVAIGGITRQEIPALRAAGARVVTAISDVLSAPDCAAVVRAYQHALALS
jgi:thiamine-phosphate pyrophosphorylase